MKWLCHQSVYSPAPIQFWYTKPLDIAFPTFVLPHCYRMEESISHFCHSQSKHALVFSIVALLAKRDQIGELVLLPSLPAPGWNRRREGEELVCDTAGVLDTTGQLGLGPCIVKGTDSVE